jgi:hypothetical protein
MELTVTDPILGVVAGTAASEAGQAKVQSLLVLGSVVAQGTFVLEHLLSRQGLQVELRVF